MVVELPFELDTIDALGEADTGAKLLFSLAIRILPFIFHLVCGIVEFLTFRIMDEKTEIICIKYFEISDPADLYMVLTYIFVLPDLVFALLGPISIFMIYNNPYSVIFNIFAGIVNIAGAAMFHVRFPNCGIAAAGDLPMAPIFGYLCGFLHVVNAAMNHFAFIYWDKEGEIYFGRLEDVVDDIKKK